MSDRPGALKQVITNGDMSAASVTSLVTLIPHISMLSYGYSWAGTTPIGVVSVEVSNDYKVGPNGAALNASTATWNTLTFLYNGALVTSIPVTGNTGNGQVDIFQTGAYAIRTKYTKTSGTGTIQATVNCKVA